MADPSQADALEILRRGRAEVDALVARLSVDEIEATGTVAGAAWSVKDLIGHLASWEEMALERIAWARQGVPADPPDFPGVDALNRRNVERKREWSLQEVRSASARTRAELEETISGLSDEEWAAPLAVPGAEVRPLGVVLGRVLSGDGAFDHDVGHLPDLQAYVQSLGR